MTTLYDEHVGSIVKAKNLSMQSYPRGIPWVQTTVLAGDTGRRGGEPTEWDDLDRRMQSLLHSPRTSAPVAPPTRTPDDMDRPVVGLRLLSAVLNGRRSADVSPSVLTIESRRGNAASLAAPLYRRTIYE